MIERRMIARSLPLLKAASFVMKSKQEFINKDFIFK
jgi:hypothetical protein